MILRIMILLFVVGTLPAAEPLRAGLPKVSDTQIAELTHKLADPSFYVRETAAKSLIVIGPAAIPHLQKVMRGDHFEASTMAENLIGQIRQKAANDEMLRPSLVSLDIDNRPLQDVLTQIHIQTGYKMIVADDLGVLQKPITIRTNGKIPIWDALDQIGRKMNLITAEVLPSHKVPTEPSNDREMILRQKEAELVRVVQLKKMVEFEVQVDILKKRVELTEQVLPNLKGKEKADAQNTLANLKAELAYAEKQVRAYREILGQATPPTETPRGSIVLKSARGDRLPSCVSGSVRITAVPFPEADVSKIPANRVPVLLEMLPEPHLRWVNASEVYAHTVRNQDDRELKTDFITPARPFYYAEEFRARKRLRIESYESPVMANEYEVVANRAYLKLLAHETSPSTRLKTLEGFVVANVWTDNKAQMSVDLKLSEPQFATGPSQSTLSVTLMAEKDDPKQLFLEVMLSYNSSKVKFLHDSHSPESFRLEDANGNRISISSNSYSTTEIPVMNVVNYIIKNKYRIRANPNAGPPVKLSIVGSSLEQIHIPFKLTDVPVRVGTGTAMPKDDPDIIYKR